MSDSPLLSSPGSTVTPVGLLPPPSPPKPPADWKVEQPFVDSYNSWHHDRTPENGAKLLSAVDPVIRAGLRTYASDSGPTGLGRARLTVMKALPSYDPTRSGLKAFVNSHLQSLQRFRAGQMNAVKMPERTILMQNTLRRAETDLTDRLGRPPSAAELADHTGVPATVISNVRRAKVALPEGAFAEGYDDDSSYGSDPAVRAADNSGWVRLLYHSSDPRDQLVLEHTLGLFGSPVLATREIAKRLGVSPAAVSQRKAKLQAILDKRDQLELV